MHERVPLAQLFPGNPGDAGVPTGLGDVLRGCQIPSSSGANRKPSILPDSTASRDTDAAARAGFRAALLSCGPMPPRDARDPATGREDAQRREMVTRFVATRGVDDPRVLAAMQEVPAPPLRARAAARAGLRRSLPADRVRPDDLAALRRRRHDAAARRLARAQGPRDRLRLGLPDGGPGAPGAQRLLARADRRAGPQRRGRSCASLGVPQRLRQGVRRHLRLSRRRALRPHPRHGRDARPSRSPCSRSSRSAAVSSCRSALPASSGCA